MSRHLSHGAITHDSSSRKTDYLFRVSMKCLIRNEQNQVLVVKEAGRDAWDLPGGGMDHAEDIKAAIRRELHEEVSLDGDFTYKIIDVDNPHYLNDHDIWQVRLVFAVYPENMVFSRGEDADEIAFMDIEEFKASVSEVERRILRYDQTSV